MRVIFAGTPDAAVPTLEAIYDAGHEIALVITQPDAPGKRGSSLHPSPVKLAAAALGLRVETPERASAADFVSLVADLDADVAAVVAYGQILKAPLLEAVRHGWVNLHFSLLPAWRGAAPVQRALMAGDDVTGASTFVIEAGLDTGPLIGSLVEEIRSTDTAGDLLSRLADAGAPLMVRSLEALVDGSAQPRPQGHEGVSHAAKLSRQDAYVRWELPAHVVDRQIRGCTPAPGAWSTLPDGSVAKLGPVRLLEDAPATVPGQLVVAGDEVLAGTGTQAVALGWIHPAGKRPMPAAQWWRGARLPEGALLGET